MGTDFFRDKTILILSPQPWYNLFISKHNYARAFAAHNKVIYVGAPAFNSKGYKLVKPENELNLEVLEYNISLPEKIKFHWPGLYRFFIKHTLRKILAEQFNRIDVCIDFGCYQQYRSLDWMPAKTHIFFPVDDHDFLTANDRGAHLVLSVSENICKKFSASGKPCHFINHGLNKEFEENALGILKEEKFWKSGEKIKAGYSGNLFIPFLDIPVLKKIVQENAHVEFHFFGTTHFNKQNKEHAEWDHFLRNTPNVVLHGFLHPKELVQSLNDMDVFLLCYKPDYKNYHAENSHKVFEYLSTGKVLISTYLSIYRDNPLMLMSGKDNNEELTGIFASTIKCLEEHNSLGLQKERIALSLDNTYNRQIKRIGHLIEEIQ
ncbi:hypothetical protein [Agriterribacter sp.]|uniref:hypothetical protein n=1 Tax=Agriterribacter sp. TaxID=2821509 RepID=UPI002B950198|nr:hypothetical protein [Agriterribacter sp.]HTN06112.1 hypothetical protein [Agriterribacter sp.]